MQGERFSKTTHTKEPPETALIPERPTETGKRESEREKILRQINKRTSGESGGKKASKTSNFKGVKKGLK